MCGLQARHPSRTVLDGWQRQTSTIIFAPLSLSPTLCILHFTLRHCAYLVKSCHCLYILQFCREQIYDHIRIQLVLLTKIYPPLLTSVQPIYITKTLLIVPTKNEKGPPLFTSKLLIKFQNILRNTTQVIIRHRVNILFSVISSPITLERQK